MMVKKNILVTGGAGYIGSHVLLLLEKQGHRVVVVDNLSTGKREQVSYGHLVVGDIGRDGFIESLMGREKFDAVIHFAGSIVVPESVKKPLKYYRNNTHYSQNLIRVALDSGVKSFIFSSTAAVYGMPTGGFCGEETPTDPINPYGRSKLMTEWILQDTCKHEAMNFIALRYFNVAGANVKGRAGQCSPQSTHLIKIACETALGKREKMVIFGDDYDTPDGTCVRDYIHVDDLAQAHMDALSHLDNGGESLILNCGLGHGFSVREVLSTMQKVAPAPFPMEVGPRREGDSPFLVAKSNKIRNTLGWSPRYDDLELICRTALDWEAKLQ